jgi:hypothetical protein
MATGRHVMSAPVAANPSPSRLPRPTPAQLVWQNCEIGLLYSFDLAADRGDGR